MILEPDSVRLKGIGEKAALADRQWAHLELRFKDVASDHFYSIDLKLLVPKRADVTLRELQEAARATAIVLMRTGADLLDRETIENLEREEAEREAAEAARLNETFGDLSE